MVKNMGKLTQRQRLEILEKKIKLIDRPLTIPQKICLEKLRLIREHPEYEDKIDSFEEKRVFCTSSRDIILFVKVGRIKV